MAYFGDPAQIKVINFIPVRMVGGQHPSAQHGSLSALGTDDTRRYSRYSIDPPERTYPYATLTICDAQRHLVAAGKLPRSGVDGVWGTQSKNALWEFVKTMPLAAARAVYTDNQDRANIPPLGSREDYKLVGRDQIRIPQAYAMAFPAKANVRCGSAPAVTPDSVPPSLTPPPADQPPPEATPQDSMLVRKDDQGGAAAEASGMPWGWIAGIGTAVLVAVLFWPRSEEEPEDSQE